VRPVEKKDKSVLHSQVTKLEGLIATLSEKKRKKWEWLSEQLPPVSDPTLYPVIVGAWFV